MKLSNKPAVRLELVENLCKMALNIGSYQSLAVVFVKYGENGFEKWHDY